MSIVMPRLGAPIVYTVREAQKTVTKQGDKMLYGSTYHPEMTEFAGLVVGAPNADAETATIMIFPPFRPAVFLDKTVWGNGPGTFREVS